MFMLNGQPLALDAAFTTEDGTQYPANWLRLTTTEEKQAIGITEVADPESYDDRFYWGPNNPKDLDQLKASWTQWTNDAAWLLLQKTDYMDSRKANDPSYNAPADWLAWRDSVRSTTKQTISAIASATDVETLKTAIAVQWPNDPN